MNDDWYDKQFIMNIYLNWKHFFNLKLISLENYYDRKFKNNYNWEEDVG